MVLELDKLLKLSSLSSWLCYGRFNQCLLVVGQLHMLFRHLNRIFTVWNAQFLPFALVVDVSTCHISAMDQPSRLASISLSMDCWPAQLLGQVNLDWWVLILNRKVASWNKRYVCGFLFRWPFVILGSQAEVGQRRKVKCRTERCIFLLYLNLYPKNVRASRRYLSLKSQTEEILSICPVMFPMTVAEMGTEKSPFLIFWTAVSLQIQIWSLMASEHSLILYHGLFTCLILLKCKGIWTVLTCSWGHLLSSGRCVGPGGDSEFCVWVLASQIPCLHLSGGSRERLIILFSSSYGSLCPCILSIVLIVEQYYLQAMLALHRKAMRQQEIISWPHIFNPQDKPTK